MKLRERVSWLMGTLQRYLFPRLEECGERPLTEKEEQLTSILEVLHFKKFAGRPPRRFGRMPWERSALARTFVAKKFGTDTRGSCKILLLSWERAAVLKTLCKMPTSFMVRSAHPTRGPEHRRIL